MKLISKIEGKRWYYYWWRFLIVLLSFVLCFCIAIQNVCWEISLMKSCIFGPNVLEGCEGGGGRESSEPWDTLPTLWKAWKEDLIFDGMSHSGDRGLTASTRRCVYRLSFLSHRKGGLQRGAKIWLLLGAHRVHRVALNAFWVTFHHEGKISPGWRGWGCTPPPAFHYIYLHVRSCGVLRSNWEGRYMCTPPISPLPLYVLCNRTLAQWRRICVRLGTGYPELTDKNPLSRGGKSFQSARNKCVYSHFCQQRYDNV
jgi:hypothetical protein